MPDTWGIVVGLGAVVAVAFWIAYRKRQAASKKKKANPGDIYPIW